MKVASATVQELLTVSNAIRRGEQADPAEAFAIARRLAEERYIEHARNLAQHICTSGRSLAPAQAVALAQKWALWTSQNPDAPDDSKHDDALAILETAPPAGAQLSQTDDPETLGIAGGICKRRWLIDGQRQTLERSLSYYERGARQGIDADGGYTAINAAFVLDLLASQEGQDGEARRQRARELRTKVRDTLLALKSAPVRAGEARREASPWFWETLAEAHVGLHEYPQASAALQQAYSLRTPKPWERETTARQFAWLARLHDPDARSTEAFMKSPAWGVLRAVYGGNTTAGAGSLFAGKLGLALSGGGFRASLFHIGVLAAPGRAATCCATSRCCRASPGGSIVGAHYYLEVRKLLQDKADGEITREDYIELVERVAREFLAGVQRQLPRAHRHQPASPTCACCSARTTPRRHASRELYEKQLYAPRRGRRAGALLRELLIRPKEDGGLQVPKYDNWHRIKQGADPDSERHRR